MQVRNGEPEAFNKGVVPLTAKKTVPTRGGSVFFARPNLIKMGTAHRSRKFTNYKIHDRYRSNSHHKTGHVHKPHNRSTFLQIRASPFALPVHRQNLPRLCTPRSSHRQNRLIGRQYRPRIVYAVRCRTILETPLYGFHPYPPKPPNP